MIWLLTGLLLFIGMHSISTLAPTKRADIIERKGDNAWKGIYTVVSLIGFALIIWGYGQTRVEPTFVWNPPRALLMVTVILTWLAFLFLAAVNVPNNHLKKMVGHPMIIGVKLWAFSHLLSNGRLGDIVLFGSFLVWAIVYYAVNRKRDRLKGVVHSTDATTTGTAITVIAGTLVWGLFAFLLHSYLIGVHPFRA